MEGGDDYEGEDDFIYAEYTIDDSLSSIERIEKYYKSDFSLQRLVLVREIYDTAVETGYAESQKRLLPLMNSFVADAEPAVRQVFAEQLYPLASYFLHADNEAGYNEVLNTFIPYTFELIIDKNLEVSQAATDSLIKMAELIKKEHLEPHLLSVVVNLAHDERVEEYRIAAARLFSELASSVGEKLCREVIIDEISLLSEDPSLLVRKTVAQSLGKICKIIGSDSTVNKVLPLYLNLCKDDIWGVRKAAAESLPSMSICVPGDLRASKIVQLFKAFAEDVSRWVKIEAYKQLGPLIATYKDTPEGITSDLIHHFTSMALAGEQDSDMIEFCAYNFPAVVQTLGKEKWNLLEPTYLSLVKDVQWKVRKTLAYSLHEIAAILGQELTESVLSQAFELFLKDLDEVKAGVISNLTKFLRHVGGKMRTKYLGAICSIPSENNDNWRIRQELARQLGGLSQLYTIQQVRTYLMKLIHTLYNDQFAEVRNTAITSAGIILKRLQADPEAKKEFIQYMVSLSKGKCFARQMFVKGCQFIFAEIEPKLFEQEFFPFVVELAHDKTANIRLQVSIVINYMLQDDAFKDNAKLLELREVLKQDKDRDVSYHAVYCIVTTGHATLQEQSDTLIPPNDQEEN